MPIGSRRHWIDHVKLIESIFRLDAFGVGCFTLIPGIVRLDTQLAGGAQGAALLPGGPTRLGGVYL